MEIIFFTSIKMETVSMVVELYHTSSHFCGYKKLCSNKNLIDLEILPASFPSSNGHSAVENLKKIKVTEMGRR